MIAAACVVAVAIGPRSWVATAVAAGLALLAAAVTGGDSVGEATRATAPTAVFLLVAVGASTVAVALGVSRGAARRLVTAARGSGRRLFALVCVVTAVLTALVSLDGAVVLTAPVVVDAHRRFGAPLRPLLLAVVGVANTSSLSVPQGNPTNLVVIERLGLPLGHAAARTVVPGIAATLLCALAVGWFERRALATPLSARGDTTPGQPLLRGLLGVARISVQILALLVVLLPLVGHTEVAGSGLLPLLGVTVSVSALAALANNLPASTIVAAALSPGPAAYAALIGLSVGALATPQGSVATLIAGDLAGERAHSRLLLPVALGAALVATVVLWLT